MATELAANKARLRTGIQSRLLVSASILAIVAVTPQAWAQTAPAAAPKWAPYASIGAQGGDQMNGIRIVGFDPIWQNLDSLIYLRVGFGTQNNASPLANIGAGYRTKFSDQWIGGVYAGFDFDKSRSGHNYSQFSAGGEVMSADWDFRVNGYAPFSTSAKSLSGYELAIQGTSIAILQKQEEALASIDAQVGYRVFSTDVMDARLYGGYNFVGSTKFSKGVGGFNIDDNGLSGWTATGEIDLYDMDVFSHKSRLILTGEVAHDDQRGTQGYAGFSLQIPLGDTSTQDADEDELDRRMVDPVRRHDYVQTTSEFANPDAVVMSNGAITSHATNTIYYVDNTSGSGSYANPTTFQNATAHGPSNQFIVLTDRNGPVDATGVTVRSGETVTGPGTFTVTGVHSGVTFTHDFAPGSGPVHVTTTAANGITVQGDTNLNGFEIDGPFTNAIYGHNVSGVHIAGVTINGGGTGANGIYILQDDGTSHSDITITGSTISGVTDDGIKLAVDNATGSTASESFNLTNDNITAGIYGVSMSATVSGGSVETTYLGIHDSTISGGTIGVLSSMTADVGSTLNDTLVVDPTVLSGGLYGIYVGAYANGGTLNQSVYLDHVTVNGTTDSGIYVDAFANNGGTINQNVTMTHVSVTGGEDSIVVVADSEGGSTVNQNLTMSNVTVSGGTENGIFVGAYSSYGTVTQHADLSYVTVTGAANDGLFIGAGSYEGTATQTVNIYGSSFANNGRNGVYVSTEADNFVAGDTSLTTQFVGLANTILTGNGADGIYVYASAQHGASANQTIYLTGVSSYGNIGNGFSAYAEAGTKGGGGVSTAEQYITILHSTLDDNANYGARFSVSAEGAGNAVTQGVASQYTTFSGNGAGMAIYAGAFDGAAATQVAYLSNITVDNNTAAGIYVNAFAVDGGAGATVAGQYIGIVHSDVSNNAHDGVELTAYSEGATAKAGQLIGAVYSTFNNNNESGIYLGARANDGGTTTQFAYVVNSTMDGNANAGIFGNVNADSGGTTEVTVAGQYIAIGNSDISNNGGYGAQFRSRAVSAYAASTQQVNAQYSTFDGNGTDGLHAFEIAYDGASANQSLYLQADDFSKNGGDGVYVVSIAVDQASTKQTIEFGYHSGVISTVEGNTNDGIYIGTAAFNGATAYQSALIYNVNASHNKGDGLGFGAGSNGYGFGASYIYYSHVSQNAVVYADSFDHNAGNGIAVHNTLYYGGAMDQELEIIANDMSHNGGAGFYSATHLTSIRGNSFSFSTNTTSTLYLIGDTANFNGSNGIDIRSYANGAVYAPTFFGGYNYMVQHNIISGVTADHNGGAGLSVLTQTSGRYTLNAEYFTVSGSKFDANSGNGAQFTSSDYYGPGGFGDSFQQVSISGTDFSGNGANGLALYAEASGRQGRAEQHFTITNSRMDGNQSSGLFIYASAQDGVYLAGHPCTTAQGLPGGCAFDRQSVVVDGTDISKNGNDGIDLTTYANNYGAIYGASGRPHTPTLDLYGDTVDHNGNRGLNVSNHVSGNSYLYQYVANVDSHFDANQGDGIYTSSYVGGGSTMLQRDLLYSYHTGASAHNNGGNGFKATIEALGGSYARDVNIVQGVNLSNNGSFGFDGAVAYADAASTGLQINAVYFNTINHNGDGVGLYSIGAGAQQISYVGDNHIIGNAFVGVYGEANFGAFQYVGVYSFGNDVHTNGTNYLFNAFGGSTQILN